MSIRHQNLPRSLFDIFDFYFTVWYLYFSSRLAWMCHFTTHSILRAAPRPKGQRHRKGGKMNESLFFDVLRNQKWALYVPERTYRAHQDGLIRGWGILSRSRRWPGQIKKIQKILNLLQSQDGNLKIPFLKTSNPDYWEQQFLDQFGDRLLLYSGVDDYPPLPRQVIASDALWDSLKAIFSSRQRVICWDQWVYCVQFHSVWVTNTEHHSPSWDGSVDGKERNQKAGEVKAKRRRLRNEYDLKGEYLDREAVLTVLKKAYPPNQVKRVRRQLEEILRHNSSEVIRCALERGIVK